MRKFNKKAEEFSDLVSHIAGTPLFLIVHIFWWAVWMGFGLEPYPFGMLTLIVSLEAIMLSGLLLSSGNREGEIERKLARKDLRISTETNLLVEDLIEMVKDLQDNIDAQKEE